MEKDTKKDRLTRDCMLYMEHRLDSYGKPEDFASCSTCFMWMGEERKRCYILGKELEVRGIDSCGIYVNGEPEVERAGSEKNLSTVEESGFTKDPVTCKNCYWYGLGMCGLFTKLNLEWPQFFDLKISVSENGCCDGFTPKDAEFDNESFIAKLNKKVIWKNPI